MFSQKYLDDVPVRPRNEQLQADAASQSTRASSVRRQPQQQQQSKPWFAGSSAATAGVAAAASAAAVAATTTGATSSTFLTRLSGSARSSVAMLDCGLNVSNADTGNKPINQSDIRPMPYHDYNPIVVRQTQNDQELPIHYWFYIYLYSSDVDKLLTPFVKMVDSFGADRRLNVIMNRCGVQILLKELELYKSLPRRIVVIKGAQWTSIVKALLEMEERLPDLMRFATFPLLLDTDTTKYACTKFDRTACINRMSKLIH